MSSQKKHPLITGTVILTLTGLITRVMGFFYRIFLSHTIGAEGVGIYQLIFPVYALCFSFAVAGIQTGISRCCACSKKSRKSQKLFFLRIFSFFQPVRYRCRSFAPIRRFPFPFSFKRTTLYSPAAAGCLERSSGNRSHLCQRLVLCPKTNGSSFCISVFGTGCPDFFLRFLLPDSLRKGNCSHAASRRIRSFGRRIGSLALFCNLPPVSFSGNRI